ncbi:TBC1 domain family member 30 [Exaiptasia diaphana]|uniref:TBC1 domain family member 30 n=1 Tax=Exaiptasia diaphana TaxID=2652724 RepID=A0A913X1L7_EXADI|nr:TBC1 domain family member 30 [Exaiptasia diaphana]KXJ16227.1 TBC1 domain family member 30 [Exaiptasia diaphana]
METNVIYANLRATREFQISRHDVYKMADALLQSSPNDLGPLRSNSTEDDSVCTEDSSLSPKSIESDWSFTTFGSKANSLEDDYDGRSNDVFVGTNGDFDCTDKKSSIVDGLLFEIYDHYHTRDSVDSDNVTECSTTSGSIFGESFDLEDQGEKWTRNSLQSKDLEEIRVLAKEYKVRISMLSAKLVKQLKRRAKNAYKLQKNFDILTAVLQAVSLKRRVDTRIRFSYIPQNGKKAFRQWLDAFKSIARLPQGLPAPWRKRLWLCLAEHSLSDLDWSKTAKFCFNEKRNPDDDELGTQIVKDLHRTGCAWFCGDDTPEERAALKRVLLAYARWNKSVGYCQGFNVVAALILQVMGRNEEDSLKVMIYIIDHVLPTNYFSNNLRALSVDMAVLRDLMRLKLPKLSRHLDTLQAQAIAQHGGSSGYEPPLINVFTMQWFLTLFSTCLPQDTVLRVWDSILLDGSEVLLRVAVAIWAKLGEHLEDVETSDEFYGKMGVLIQEIAQGDLIDCQALMQTVYSVAPFPLPGLAELREQYTYDIHPFSDRKNSRSNLGNASSDEDDEDIDTDSVGCLGVLLPFSEFSSPPGGNSKTLPESEFSGRKSSDIAQASPGVFATDVYSPVSYTSRQTDRKSSTSSSAPEEVSNLQRQYSKIRQLQQQAVVVFSEATVQNIQDADKKSSSSPSAINHLFVSATKRRPVRGKPSTNSESAEKTDEKVQQNAYEKESTAHLNTLFKGNHKPNDSHHTTSTPKSNSPPSLATTAKPKLEHVGLNGEVCKLEVPENHANGHKPVSLHSANENSYEKRSLGNNPSSKVEVLKENSPAVFVSNNRTEPRGKSNVFQSSSSKKSLEGPSKDSSSSIDNPFMKSWMLQEDQRCKYPANFNPFPQRSKATPRSRILYGNISDKGGKRKEAFQARKAPRPTKGNCIGEEVKLSIGSMY